MKSGIIIENYGIKKLTQPLILQFLSSCLAGIFVGIAYTAMLVLVTAVDKSDQVYMILKFLGALMFSIAILLCCVFGASLFTGNCLGVLSCFHKQTKWKYFFYNLSITFIGNYVGCVVFAGFIFLTSTFAGASGQWFIPTVITERVIEFGLHKVIQPWWQTGLSAILCNIVVAGCLIVWLTIDNKAGASMIIILLLSSFVLGGYQHVVANMFVTTLAAFLSCLKGATSMASHTGELFYNCLMPCIVGNFIGGIFIAVMSYLLSDGKFKKHKFDPPLVKH